jgi:succinylglutamic semialdehyde dehydrogenase
MAEGRGDYIGGRFVRAPRGAPRLVSENPGDLSDPVGVFRPAPQHVELAVAAARRALPRWSALRTEARAYALLRIQAELARRGEALAQLLVREVGRPLWETRQEVATMQAKVDVTLGESLAEIAERRPPGLRGRLVHRPLGVVAVVAPFNFPAHLPHGQVLPALVSGCTVVVKPSELTPATGELYAEILHAARLPPGVFNLVQGGPPIGRALVAHQDVAAVFFIGSYATGMRILEATRDQPDKLVALELGGKNAAIVLPDADLDLAAYEIARSAYITAGQRCSSTCRVVVDRRVERALTERLARLATGLRVGYGMDEDVFMGPLVSGRARRRFLRALADAARAGVVEPIVGPRKPRVERAGHYVTPTLHRVLRPDVAHPYLRDELFGPDLAIYPVRGLEAALARANDSAYGLCMSVFTRDRAAFERVLADGRAGVINWNRGTVGSSPRLPFGGVGRSGNHRPAGIYMIRACTRPVASLENPTGLDAAALPPGMPML